MGKPLLFVIARDDRKRHALVSQLFAAQPDVEVVCDRRAHERRTSHFSHVVKIERRRRERRSFDISPDLSVKGWACIPHPDTRPGFWLPEPRKVIDTPRYAYYRGSTAPQTVERKLQAAQLSHEILNPSLRNPDFLVLRERRRVFSQWIENLPGTGLCVLDVGGRLQPYRSLLGERVKCYMAIDPILEGLLNVIAVGEHLPFPTETFDLVICTQVLNYTDNPSQVIAEIHRVLRPGGFLFLSVPAIFPRYGAQRWRFMPEGLMVLLSPFSFYEIVPEGYSIAGLFRLFNLFLDTFAADALAHWERVRRLMPVVVFPVANVAGVTLDRLSRGNSRFTTNYSCLVVK